MSDITVQDFSSLVTTNYSLPEVGTEQTLGADDFLKLLVAQMQNQDPLEPTSNEEWITQMAQLTASTRMSDLCDQFQINAGLTSISTASSLIGKEVTYTDSDTETVTVGIVDGVVMSGDNEFVLLIDGKEVSLSDVEKITAQESPT